MSNSVLVNYTKLSPYYTKFRNKKVKAIALHCMAGNLSIETCGNVFQNREASSNYGVGTDGRIGLYVEEINRAWTTSTSYDHYAVTIEIANDGGAPSWHASDNAIAATIKLCADICKRNGITKMNWFNNKNKTTKFLDTDTSAEGAFFVHRWFAAKSCPGDYIMSKMQYICDEVNKLLGSSSTPVKPTSTPTQPDNTVNYKEGDIIKLKPNATYDNGASIPSFVFKSTLYYRGKNNRGIIFSTQKTGAITGVVKESAIDMDTSTTQQPANSISAKSYKVQVTCNALNIRKGPGTSYGTNGMITDKGIYTIIEENGRWGKLKSGAGWIYLNYTKKI